MQTLLFLCALAVGTLALTPAEIREFRVRDFVDHNTGMKGTVSVTERTDTITIVSNAIPDHATPVYPNPENPFPIVPQNLRITVPKNPQVANQTTCLNMGPVGVAINGVPIFNPFSLECRDASVYEVLDECDGHPSPRGEYHYHIHPDCVFDGTSTHSQIVGVAADGFPIYGPVDENGIVLTNADLDECHGRMKDGVYRYHVTNEYPYFMACYKGVVRADSGVSAGQCMCPVYPDGTDTNDIEDTDPYPYPIPQDLPPGFNLAQLAAGLRKSAAAVSEEPLQDETAHQQPLTLYQIWQQHQPTCQEWREQQWKNFQRAFAHWQQQQQQQQQQQALHQPATADDAAESTQFRPRAPFPSQ